VRQIRALDARFCRRACRTEAKRLGFYQSLKALGQLLGFPKIDLPLEYLEQMSKLLRDDPALFEAYAVRDAEVSAAWLIKILRFFEDELGIEPGRQPPATLGAAAVKKFRTICKGEDYDVDDRSLYHRSPGHRGASHNIPKPS
jgi:hypothetical protein